MLDREECIFIDAVPIGGNSSSVLLDRLPEIVRCATKADAGLADVHRFMDRLVDADSVLFSGVLLFSRDSAERSS